MVHGFAQEKALESLSAFFAPRDSGQREHLEFCGGAASSFISNAAKGLGRNSMLLEEVFDIETAFYGAGL